MEKNANYTGIVEGKCKLHGDYMERLKWLEIVVIFLATRAQIKWNVSGKMRVRCMADSAALQSTMQEVNQFNIVCKHFLWMTVIVH